MVKNERDSIDEDVNSTTGKEAPRRDGLPHKNQMSLRISTETSLKLL